jgi:hypothetical protein
MAEEPADHGLNVFAERGELTQAIRRARLRAVGPASTPTLDTFVGDLAAVADAAGLEQAALQVAATTRTHPAARSHAPLGRAAALVGAA